MNDEFCPICGAKIIETNLGGKLCPNCGIITQEKKSEIKDNELSYVG